MPNPYSSPLVVDVADGAQILNTTTETIMAPNYSFAANDARIYQGAGFEIECWFDVSNVVTTPGTLTFRVRWGGVAGTVLASSGAISLDTTAHTSFSGHLRSVLIWRSIGSAGSAFCQGIVFLNNTTVGAAADPQWQTMGSAGENVPAVVASLDTTTAKDLAVTAQFSVSTATTQLTNHIRILRAISTQSVPAPTPVPGVTSGPPVTPASRAVRVEANNAGSRGGGGLTPNAIRRGVNIAFGSPANSEAPLWQNLNDLGPT